MLPFVLLPLIFGAGVHGGRPNHHLHNHPQSASRGLVDIDVDVSLRVGYELTWSDEFVVVPGSKSPLAHKWIFDLGTSYPGGAPNWGNNEKEVYTASPDNVHITSSNTLAITPRLSNGTWTSGRIETRRSDFAATPGGKLFVEGRLKTGCAPSDQQQGIWPAFWALGEDFRGNYTNWPAASEWDFLEVVNGLPTAYSTLHCGIAPGGPCNEYNGLGSGGVPWTPCDWHWVGFEVDRSKSRSHKPTAWRDEKLRWFLDGKQILEISGAKVNDSATWESIAHKGHFLLLNVAVGGNWPGQPNVTTIGGPDVQLEVDFVRVWNSY